MVVGTTSLRCHKKKLRSGYTQLSNRKIIFAVMYFNNCFTAQLMKIETGYRFSPPPGCSRSLFEDEKRTWNSTVACISNMSVQLRPTFEGGL